MVEIEFCGQCNKVMLSPRVALARGSGNLVRGVRLCPPCGWAEGHVDRVWDEDPLLHFDVSVWDLDDFQLPDKWEIWNETLWDIFDGAAYKKLRNEYDMWIARVLGAPIIEIRQLPDLSPDLKGPKIWGWQDGKTHST